MTKLAVKLTGSESDVVQHLANFTAWLGRSPDMLLAFLDNRAWRMLSDGLVQKEAV